ncbi:GntR family transcriptional regulator [Conexibacter sp. CPCC 206217]|uniref:GntR family transcriptional regulator n=1 Tax=Conexibacter sp. CPCC 206217 TaxID=3064574 RepID=UPI0027225AF0|nr:GntR family transcriptional regulator [Conexibacter sp. CPCC 206217]MDO8212528.1 GntR family transcriptional regulator [Conexibacter sp. CPCC 206217]
MEHKTADTTFDTRSTSTTTSGPRGPARTSGSLVDRLAGEIQDAILSGEFPVGSRLPQEALAARFKVSRTPVREAIRKLEAADLLTIVPNVGAVVRGPTPRAIREAYLVRAELEGLAVELATPRISDDQLLLLRATEQQFLAAVREVASRPAGVGEAEALATQTAWNEANDAFHEVIQQAAGNERLQKTVSDLHMLFPRSMTWAPLSSGLELLSENVDQHRRIREAIERREPSTARLLMTYHVHRAGELVAQWFERQAAESGDAPS